MKHPALRAAMFPAGLQDYRTRHPSQATSEADFVYRVDLGAVLSASLS